MTPPASPRRAAEVLREYAAMIEDSEKHHSGPLKGRCDDDIEKEIAEYRALADTLEAMPPIVNDAMVDRFLSWPLPDSVCADLCATKQGYPNRIGTNLLTANEARQMLEHVVSARPTARVGTYIKNAERAPVLLVVDGEPTLLQPGSELHISHEFTPLPVINKAASDVLAERQRQVEKEGWTSEHDDGHVDGAMAVAAACYSLDAAKQITEEHHTWSDRYEAVAKELWPWDAEWWKPKDARRDLVRAGALILAEIEKCDRADQEKP